MSDSKNKKKQHKGNKIADREPDILSHDVNESVPNMDLSSWAGEINKKKKHKKHRKDRKISDADMDKETVSVYKGKKRKRKPDLEMQNCKAVQIMDPGELHGTVNETKVKHKEKKKESTAADTSVSETNVEELNATVVETEVKRKKKKKGSTVADTDSGTSGFKEKEKESKESTTVSKQMLKRKKKDKKDKDMESGILNVSRDSDQEIDDIMNCHGVPRKSKHHKKCKLLNGDEDGANDSKNNTDLPNNEGDYSKDSRINAGAEKQRHGKKRKKHSKVQSDLEFDADKLVSYEEEVKPKKSRKHKDSDAVDKNHGTEDLVSENVCNAAIKPKKKKKKSKNEKDIADDEAKTISREEPKKHKKKKSKHKNDEQEILHENSELFPGELVRGDDHHGGDKSELPPQISASTSSSITPTEGQWKGDMFECVERQNKFLRLMGGMKMSTTLNSDGAGKNKNGLFPSQNNKKKGLFGSLTSMTTKSVGGNTALSSAAAASVDQRLEEDYNRATRKKGHGIWFHPRSSRGEEFSY